MEECPITELKPSMCACPKHLNKTLIDEPNWLIARTFVATYDGTCPRCRVRFLEGDRIARTVEDAYIHPECGKRQKLGSHR